MRRVGMLGGKLLITALVCSGCLGDPILPGEQPVPASEPVAPVQDLRGQVSFEPKLLFPVEPDDPTAEPLRSLLGQGWEPDLLWSAQGVPRGLDGSGPHFSEVEPEPIFPLIRVNINQDASQQNPDLAVLQGGQVVVTWTSKDGAKSDVAHRVFDVVGDQLVGITAEKVVFNDTDAGNKKQLASRVLALPETETVPAGYLLTWESKHSTSGDIYFQLFDTDGSARTEVIRANLDALIGIQGTQRAPTALVLADSFFLFWESGSNPDLYGSRWSFQGEALTDVLTMVDAAGPQREPRAMRVAGDQFALGWSNVAGEPFQVQLFSAVTAEPVGVPHQGADWVGDDQTLRDLYRDASGGGLVLWDATSESDGGGVFLRRYAQSGFASGDTLEISETGGADYRAGGVAVSDAGHLLVCYVSTDQGGTQGIVVRSLSLLSDDTVEWATDEQALNVDPLGHYQLLETMQTEPRCRALQGVERAVVVWSGVASFLPAGGTGNDTADIFARVVPVAP